MHLADLFNLKYAEEIVESLYEAEDNDEVSTFEDQDVWMANMINKLNASTIKYRYAGLVTRKQYVSP